MLRTMHWQFLKLPIVLPIVCTIAAIFVPALAYGQAPRRLSPSKIEILKRDGDRLADQGDFQGALEKYTTAYLGVVSRIRGQAFDKAVPPNIYSREELGKEMHRMMEEEYTAEELELLDGSYKAFGLVPASMDCKQVVTQLLTEEVAGFYDPDSKRMVLIVEEGSAEDPGWLGRLLGAKPTFDKDEQKTTLAHELTHALQDQLYDLNAMQLGIEKDDDMLTAFSALVEGDATLLMFAEMDDEQDITQMDPDAIRATFNIMSWMLPLAGGETFRKSPPIFRDSLIFPYFQGMVFVLSGAEYGGWERIHQIYSNPPTSTEQILHPQKYFGKEQDTPQAVEIPDMQDLLPDWKHLGGNVLGELQTSILLSRVIGGKAAADGWDGDRYEIFKTESGSLGLISVSIWDSENDAQEFEAAYKNYREKLPVRLKQDKSEETSVFGASSSRMVQRIHDQVWLVEGFSEQQTQALAVRLKDCRFSEKKFPMPESSKQDESAKQDEILQEKE
jgi:hypothetical protein